MLCNIPQLHGYQAMVYFAIHAGLTVQFEPKIQWPVKSLYSPSQSAKAGSQDGSRDTCLAVALARFAQSSALYGS